MGEFTRAACNQGETGKELLSMVKARTFVNDTGAYITYQPEEYSLNLDEKAIECLMRTKQWLSPHSVGTRTCVEGLNGYVAKCQEYSAEVYRSEPAFYRSRCRLGVDVHPESGMLCYVMWKHGCAPARRTYIQSGEAFILASPLINDVMQKLLEYFEDSKALRTCLEMVHFLGSSTREVVITLFYSSDLLPSWGCEMAGFVAMLTEGEMGPAEKVGYLVKVKNDKGNPKYWTTVRQEGDDFVTECYRVTGRGVLRYRQTCGSFSNPNHSVCQVRLRAVCTMSLQGLLS